MDMNISSHTTQNELILSNLKEFYLSNKNYLEKMLQIITGETKMSLRIVDWFTTNYSKKYFTIYMLNGERFKVYTDYKLKLKAYSKKRFDPFCRWDRIQIPFSHNEFIETTIGQLNFFRWAFEKDILTYMRQYLTDIIREEKLARSQGTQSSTDTTVSTLSAVSLVSDVSTQSAKSTRRRRTEKVVSSTKMMHKHEFEIKLSFD